MINFSTTYLPAAPVNAAYSQQITATGGTAPYTYEVTSGSLPAGLSLATDGLVTGSATTIGIYNFYVTATDSLGETHFSLFQFTVMNLIDLSDVTVDQAQFVQQFEESLVQQGSWSTGLTTQTSQTLIELISAIGTFTTAKIVRAREDAFPETAQSDSAILAIANMQGLRLSRKLPATVPVTLRSPVTLTIDPYTQFSGAGYSWFNTQQINLVANTPKPTILKQGEVKQVSVTGRGTDLQTWVSVEDSFAVSDQDVRVAVNGTTIHKAFGGLWNFKDLNACADTTLSDGRLTIQFGSNGYGAVPGVNDVVQIDYAITLGSAANAVSTKDAKITCATLGTLTGTIDDSPSGGADEKSVLAYKNFSSGTFGTYSSAVTKSQYQAIVNNYPGIVDAVTQAQREVNPGALEWMNIIRVAGLTNSPWTQTQIEDFVTYAESVTMYSTKFVWQNPVPVDRIVDVSVFCFNSVSSTSAIAASVKNALEKLFSARPGLLMTNFYTSDLIETAMRAAPGQISYVEVNKPTGAMIVTTPDSPSITYTVTPSGGTLSPRLYSYSVSVDAPSPAGDGTTDVGTPSKWTFPQVTVDNSSILLSWDAVENATKYHIWGRRAGHIGIIHTIDLVQTPNVTTYLDVGGADPTTVPVPLLAESPIRYNRATSITVNASYASRQLKTIFPVRDILS